MARPVPPVAEERIQYVSVPDVPGLDLMTVENCSRLFRVFHESYDICVISRERRTLDAAATWRFRRWQQVALPGDLMLMEPGDAHITTKFTGRGDCWIALFSPGLVGAAAHELGLARVTHLRTCQAADPEWTSALQALRAACTGPAGLLERQVLLADCLRTFLSRYGEDRPAPLLPAATQRIRTARDFIVDYYDKSISLDDLVALTGISRFHLIRTFTRLYGAPPHQYQILVRVERARRRLRAGWSPQDAAVGFADQSHFTRHFKRVLGVTPGTYQCQVAASRRSRS